MAAHIQQTAEFIKGDYGGGSAELFIFSSLLLWQQASLPTLCPHFTKVCPSRDTIRGWSNHSLISAQPPAASISENISSLGNRSSVFSHMNIYGKVSASFPREIKVVMRATFRAQMYFMSLCAEALLLWKAIKYSLLCWTKTLTEMVIFILVALSNHSSNAVLMRMALVIIQN